MANHRNRPGYRFCNKCNSELPLTAEFFPRDRNRMEGFGYQCRDCANKARREKGDARKDRWANMSTAQRANKRDWQRRYSAGPGKAFYRVGSYRYFDRRRGFECDLDAAWFREHIQSAPCFYCGETGINGCDRIDNAKGHTKANVVPCCWTCNSTRMDAYSHAEMVRLGHAIRLIKQERQIRSA